MEPSSALFIPYCLGLWLVVTTVLGLLTGWFSLMRRYPDRDETALATLAMQSATMGSFFVSINNCLTIGVCPSGLRVGIWRIFGPFNRPFFVPWREIAWRRHKLFFMAVATLEFGQPVAGKLIVREDLARRIESARAGHQPRHI